MKWDEMTALERDARGRRHSGVLGPVTECCDGFFEPYVCRKCGGAAHYHFTGRRRECVPCRRRRSIDRYHANADEIAMKRRVRRTENGVPESFKLYQWEWKLSDRYGITADDFYDLYHAQDGVCAICGGVDDNQRLCVDHCHDSGRIRGLLCNQCNVGLANFNDNPGHMERAAEYLRENSA